MIRIIVCIGLIFFMVNATLVITNPLVTDFPDNQLEYFYANFGEVPYGKTQSFDVVLFDYSLCGNISELEHLTKPTYLVIKTSNIDTCSVTKRALSAQFLGAKGIIIASPTVDYAKGNVIESDDGNGKKVHITCLFITNESFDKLKKLSKIEIISNYPVPKQKVSTLSLFLSASKRNTYVFLRDFKAQYKFFKDYVTIEAPIYHTIDCDTCNPQSCYLDQFCCFDYQNYQPNVGQKIIRQELHQYNIFQQKGAEKWMEYMNLFDQYCGSDWSNIDQCTRQILKQLNMDDGYLPNPGQTLRFWRSREIKLGFDSFPEVAINNMIYRGNFDADQIVETLCASLQSPPKYCSDKSVQISQTVSKSSSNHVVIILLVSIFSLLILMGVGVLLYRKFIKSELTKDMSSRVSELVANYANKVSAQKKRQREKMIESFDEEL